MLTCADGAYPHDMEALHDIVICGSSALEYWRATMGRPYAGARASCHTAGAGPRRDAPDPLILGVLHDRVASIFHTPIDVEVNDPTSRRPSAMMRCHVEITAPSPKDVALLAPGVSIVSPERCFLQLARTLPLPSLVMLGCELCGTYGRDPEVQERLFQRSRPLTSVARLRDYLAEHASSRGVVRAGKALSCICDGSASPMETAYYMFGFLPCRLGGFGLPAPILNHRINLSEEARLISGRSYHVLDFCWPALGFGVEYDGRSVHTREAAFDADRRRTAALQAMGIEELALTAEQLRSDELLAAHMRLVARRIGFRMQGRSYDTRGRRLELRRQLFGRADGSARPLWPALRVGEPTLREALDTVRRR